MSKNYFLKVIKLHSKTSVPMFDIFMCHGGEDFYNKPIDYDTPLVLSYRSSEFLQEEANSIRKLR